MRYQLHQAPGRFWRKYICNEDPDDRRERLRLERISNQNMADAALRDAFRVSLESRRQEAGSLG